MKHFPSIILHIDHPVKAKGKKKVKPTRKKQGLNKKGCKNSKCATLNLKRARKLNFFKAKEGIFSCFYRICSLEVAVATSADVAYIILENFNFCKQNSSILLLSKGKLIVVYSLMRQRPASFHSCTLIR